MPTGSASASGADDEALELVGRVDQPRPDDGGDLVGVGELVEVEVAAVQPRPRLVVRLAQVVHHPARRVRVAHQDSLTRTMPSWATVATRVPSAPNIRPMPETAPTRGRRATPGRRGSSRRRAPGGGTTWRGRGSPAAAGGRSTPARAGGSPTRAGCSRRRRRAPRRGPAGRRAAGRSPSSTRSGGHPSSGPGATNRLPSTWRCSTGRFSRCRAPGWSMPPKTSWQRRQARRGPGTCGHRVLVVQPAGVPPGRT